jgi:Tfp pilus assembly protein PilN
MQSQNLVQINLLPPERRPQPGKWVAQAALLLAMVSIAAGSVVASVVVNIMVFQEESAMKKATEQIQLLREDLDEVAMLEAEENLLTTKQRIIDELILKRMEWAPKLNMISDLLPQHIWLERLYVKTETKKIRVRPNREPGQSRTQAMSRPQVKTIYTDYLYINAVTHRVDDDVRLVAQMIKNLQQSEEFVSDDFTYIDHLHSELGPWLQRDKESQDVFRFQIECKMKSRQDLDEEA